MMDVVTNRVQRLGRSDKIRWNQFRSLMDELIECMLAVGTRFTPNNWASRVFNTTTASSDVP